MKEEKAIIKRRKILGLFLGAAVLIGLFIVLWRHFDKPSHPTDLVEFWEGWENIRSESEWEDLRQSGNELRRVIISEVRFSEKPYLECLDYIFGKINQGRAAHERFTYRVESLGQISDKGVSINLANYPAVEALRDVARAIEMNYTVESNRLVILFPIGFPIDVIERKFPCSEKVFPNYFGKGPWSVVKDLEGAGITFPNGSKANYYPNRRFLIVSNIPDQMYLINMFLGHTSSFDKSRGFNPLDPFSPWEEKKK